MATHVDLKLQIFSGLCELATLVENAAGTSLEAVSMFLGIFVIKNINRTSKSVLA